MILYNTSVTPVTAGLAEHILCTLNLSHLHIFISINLRFDSFPLQFGGSQSKPELKVDLTGGSAEWASKDKSSKKHVIEVGPSSDQN